jgi:hypothetical protein
MRNRYEIIVRKPDRRDHLSNLGVNGMIILNLILKKEDLCGLDSTGSQEGGPQTESGGGARDEKSPLLPAIVSLIASLQ